MLKNIYIRQNYLLVLREGFKHLFGRLERKFPVLNSEPRQEDVRGCIQKFPDWTPGGRTGNDRALCH
jgi:hypothetical protein